MKCPFCGYEVATHNDGWYCHSCYAASFSGINGERVYQGRGGSPLWELPEGIMQVYNEVKL